MQLPEPLRIVTTADADLLIGWHDELSGWLLVPPTVPRLTPPSGVRLVNPAVINEPLPSSVKLVLITA